MNGGIMKLLIFIMMATSMIHSLNYHGCALAPDNLHAWVVCLDTVLIRHTTDGGINWQDQPVPANTKRFFDITCIDNTNAWTCGILGEILHTTDGGANWLGQVIGLSKYATRIEFFDLNYGWAVCGDGAIGRTTDGGGYWDNIFLPWLEEFYGLSFVDTLTGWIIAGYPDSMLTGQGFIFKTNNGGIGWDSVYQVSDYRDFFDVHFFNLLEGIVVGGNESDTSAIIIRTTNGGLSWNDITVPNNTYYLRAVDFVGNNGWAVGRLGTIIHTSDTGNTWVFQSNPATTTLFDVDFSDDQHGIICGQDIILMTSNGGQTWTEVGIFEQNEVEIENSTLRVYPNPVRSSCQIALAANSSIHAIKIYDISGCMVKSLPVPVSRSSDPLSIIWKGLNENGDRLPAGVYLIGTDIMAGPTTKVVLLD